MEEELSIQELITRAIDDDLTLEITYAKNSFETSQRVISDISDSDDYGPGYISAYCHMRNEQRTFKISKITAAKIVEDVVKTPRFSMINYQFDASKPIFRLYGEKY